MKLQEGVYENLITDEVKREMRQASHEGWICQQDDIDEAESPSLLAEHVSRVIKNRLSDDHLSIEARVGLVNRLMDFLGEGANERIIEGRKLLSSVVSPQEEVRLRATNQEILRPLTGFRISNLFTGGQSKVPLNVEIERDIESADYLAF